VDVGLHHHREQGPIDPPATLENGREEAAVAQLRDREFDIAGLRGQQPRAGPVPLVRAARGPLVRRSADHFGRLRVDQCLQHHLHAEADQIDIPTSAKRVEELGQVRLGQGHRGTPSA